MSLITTPDSFRYPDFTTSSMPTESTAVQVENNRPSRNQTNLERVVGTFLKYFKKIPSDIDITADLQYIKEHYKLLSLITGSVSVLSATLAATTPSGPAALVIGGFIVLSAAVSYDSYKVVKCAEIIIKEANNQSESNECQLSWTEDLRKEVNGGLYLRWKANQPYIEKKYIFW